jgi:truncated hemoglobin YjbI
MERALDRLDLDPAAHDELWNYLVMAAHSLVNTVAEPTAGLGVVSPEP